MNIMFVVNSIDGSRGGVARVTNILANYFEKNGINCYYAYFLNDNDAIPESRKIKFEYDQSYDHLQGILSKFIEQSKIDVIINQDLNTGALQQFYAGLKARNSVKIINCMHNLPDFSKYWNLGWRHKLTEWIYKLRHGHVSDADMYINIYAVVDKYVLLSESFIPIAIKYYNLSDSSKLTAISNPLSFESTRETVFRNKKKQFLIVTRLDDHQKNLRAAFRIWRKFELQNADYNLVLAGYGPDEQMLLSYAQELGIERMTFIGRIDNPFELYAESRYFMMTSRYEGFGMTLTEAQQCGCIPFAFDTYAALHDIVESGYNGYIVKGSDENAYVRRMSAAVAMSDDAMQQMAHNAYSSSQKFSLSSIGEQWMKLLNSLR